jgi:hypothetical protein
MYFQYIAVAQMAAQTLLSVDATRAKMHDTLALRFLQAAVEQTISKKVSKRFLPYKNAAKVTFRRLAG